MYKKWYRETQKQLDDTRRELQGFQAEVYEKEIIKNYKLKIVELEKELAVSQGKISAFYECNATLKDALQNISKK